jgi:hypothetical protein
MARRRAGLPTASAQAHRVLAQAREDAERIRREAGAAPTFHPRPGVGRMFVTTCGAFRATGDAFRAIDPMPRWGDPCADMGMFPTDQPAPIIMHTAAELARILDLDVDRAAAWNVVWTVLQTAQA